MSITSNIRRGLLNTNSRASDYDQYFGTIYIISTKCLCCQTRKTKIGKADAKNYKATRAKKRLKNYFATEYPDEMNVVATFFIENYNEAERRLHDYFEAYRYRGEWFDFDSNIYYNVDDKIDPLFDQDYSDFVPNNVMQKIEEIVNIVNSEALINQNPENT
jgi:Meiotically up-regulated gene 113